MTTAISRAKRPVHASDRVLIPLPGIGTLSLTRTEYEAALIPISAPSTTTQEPTRAPLQSRQADRPQTQSKQPAENYRGLRCLRLREVCARVGLRPSAVYNLISLGRFPKQVKLSERSVAWIESEVEAFMDARLAERDSQQSLAFVPSSPYMRMGEVMRRTGLNSSTIYDLIRRGEFPKWAPLPKIASGWMRADIEAWMTSTSRSGSGPTAGADIGRGRRLTAMPAAPHKA